MQLLSQHLYTTVDVRVDAALAGMTATNPMLLLLPVLPLPLRTCAWLLYGLALAEGSQLGQLGAQETLQLAPLLLAGDVVQDLPADGAGAAVGC